MNDAATQLRRRGGYLSACAGRALRESPHDAQIAKRPIPLRWRHRQQLRCCRCAAHGSPMMLRGVIGKNRSTQSNTPREQAP